MLENQSVRTRLKNCLDVQLTDSNVIQAQSQTIRVSRIFKYENESNSDMSIIHELDILNRTTFNLLQQEQIERIPIRNFRNKDQYDNQSKVKFQAKYSPLCLKSKIKAYRQQLEASSGYENVHEEILIKSGSINTKNPRNTIKHSEIRHFSNTFKDHHQIADIQEKISILPHQLQQKIKSKLQKKMSFILKQPLQTSSTNNLDLYTQNSPSSKNNIEQNEHQNVNFILPSQQKVMTNSPYLNKQKFVSLNRQNFSKNQSITKSIIIRQVHTNQMRQNFPTPHLLLNSDRNSHNSKSKQKSTFNPIELAQKVQRKHKQKQGISRSRSKSKGKGRIVAEIIDKRKKQFAELYNTKQQNNKQFNSKQNLLQIQEQFNNSKVIKYYSNILSSIPKCKKCSASFGALTLFNDSVVFACNQCDLKNGQQRSVSFRSSNVTSDQYINLQWSLQKQSAHHNHPIIGALFDMQNKLLNQGQMKTYNILLQEIASELQNMQEKKNKFMKLQNQILALKHKLKTNSKLIFESKNNLRKIFTDQFGIKNDKMSTGNQSPICEIIPCQYLQELDMWCKIKAQDFVHWPSIDKKLQILCPLYMKKNINTMRQFLDPLLHNFQNSDVRISVSQGLKLPVKSLGRATFLVDGSYNISNFDHIQKLTLQFVNKRTFRQITSMMENLPHNVYSLAVKYNHKLNSHISAEKYPLLTKLASIRTCKMLNVTLQNCKDEDDLISAMKVMTKKKQVRIKTSRSIYVRKPMTQATDQIKGMLKRLGKNVFSIHLDLSVSFKQEAIYRELIENQRNKLINFSLTSTINSEDQNKPDLSTQIMKQNDNFVSYNSILNAIDDSESERSIERINKNISPKQFFRNKLRKKLSAIAVLKQSYSEKYIISELQKGNQNLKDKQMLKNHQQKHMLRLQILKLLL